MDKQSSGGPQAVGPTLKQLTIGVSGGFIVILIIAIWGWLSGGGLVHVLGGLTVNTFNEELEKVRTQITEADQKTVSTFDEELKKVRTQVTEVNRKIEEAENQILAVSPRGAVVGFDRDDLNVDLCPEGWVSFGMPGHVIVGAGSAAPYLFRERGGAAKHTLTVDEMPQHEHHIRNFEWGHTINGNGHPARIDVDDGGPWMDNFGRLVTDSRGEGKAHNNMPPYIALYLCKKQ